MMYGLPWNRVRFILYILFFIVILDQATKLLALNYLQPIGSVSIIGDFLRFTYVENPGMAFGIQLENKLLFHSLSLIAVFIIFYYLFQLRQHPLLSIAFAVILGGAFGNLFDRFMRGSVIDFIDMDFIDIQLSGGQFLFWQYPAWFMPRWPVFNIADIAISIGMMLILVTAIFDLSSEPVYSNAASKKA